MTFRIPENTEPSLLLEQLLVSKKGSS